MAILQIVFLFLRLWSHAKDSLEYNKEEWKEFRIRLNSIIAENNNMKRCMKEVIIVINTTYANNTNYKNDGPCIRGVF